MIYQNCKHTSPVVFCYSQLCLRDSLTRYFPVREIYVQTSGFHHLQPKIENPGTTRSTVPYVFLP